MTSPKQIKEPWNKGFKKGSYKLLRIHKDGVYTFYCSECQCAIAKHDDCIQALYPCPNEHMKMHWMDKYRDTHVFFGRTMLPRDVFKEGTIYNPKIS